MQKERDYTTYKLNIKDCLNLQIQKNLSNRTKTILFWLEGKPKGWKIIPYCLAKEFGCCVETIYRALRQASAHGYVQKVFWFENGLKRERFVSAVTSKFTQHAVLADHKPKTIEKKPTVLKQEKPRNFCQVNKKNSKNFCQVYKAVDPLEKKNILNKERPKGLKKEAYASLSEENFSFDYENKQFKTTPLANAEIELWRKELEKKFKNLGTSFDQVALKAAKVVAERKGTKNEVRRVGPWLKRYLFDEANQDPYRITPSDSAKDNFKTNYSFFSSLPDHSSMQVKGSHLLYKGREMGFIVEPEVFKEFLLKDYQVSDLDVQYRQEDYF